MASWSMLEVLKRTLLEQKHRQLMLIIGDHTWRWQQVDQLKQLYPDLITLSSADTVNFWPEHNHQILGQEHEAAVFDVMSGLMPDKLASISGTIKAGGVLALLLPTFSELINQPDPSFERFQSACLPHNKQSYFLERLVTIFNQLNAVVIKQDEPMKLPFPIETNETQKRNSYQEQNDAVNLLDEFIIKKRKSCFLLTADRGRGKSAALGILAAKWVEQGKKVAISARDKSSLKTAYLHFEKALSSTQGKTLSYIAPDELKKRYHEFDILLIDEAATLPVPLLLSLLTLPIKIGFATTLFGYEGTGRGFNLRFIPKLKTLRENSRLVSLSQPIRYGLNDPLEYSINKMLALHADFSEPSFELDTKVIYRQVSQQELVQNEQLLQQIFAVLVMAHYQTSCNDLRHLLDGNNVSIFIAEQNQVVLAAALVAYEGQFTHELAQDVIAGKRRPQGHLLAQSVATLIGEPRLLSKNFARIVRIAVNPQYQKQRIGTCLLNSIESILSSEVDFFGASFGAEANLLSFWQAQSYHVIKLGEKRDKASGENACLVIKSIDSQHTVLKARGLFKQKLFFECTRQWQQLPVELFARLLVNLPTNSHIHHDLDFVKRFCSGEVPFSAVNFACFELIKAQPSSLLNCENHYRNFIIRLLLQNISNKDLLEEFGLTGKKQFNILLNQAVNNWCTNYHTN